MSSLDFHAYAVPVPEPSSPDPEMARSGYDEPGMRVRYLGATPAWIGGVASALIDAREALLDRSTADITGVLGRVGSRFLNEGDPLRAEALLLLPPTSGLSPEMCVVVLDGMAADWTEDRLGTLVRTELGSDRTLDGFEDSRMAVGPSLCVQIVAGGVPGVGVSALLRSLLLKGPTLLKPGRGDVVLPVLFARALREADPELADALAVVYWPGGQRELEGAALARADVVTAYGSDETVRELRARTPDTARFVAYHHRVSVGIVGRDALVEDRMAATAAEVAWAVAMFDQRGCVSPQVIFVEEGGAQASAAFAAALAEQLRLLEDRLPSGPLDAHDASELHQLRGTAELLAVGGDSAVFHGGDAPWTVILQEDTRLPVSCSGRVIRVRAVPDVAHIPGLIEPLGPHLQTVGVAGLGDRLSDTATALGRLGASRIVPFRSVAFPPPWWHHDGRGPLRDLLRWVDLEGE